MYIEEELERAQAEKNRSEPRYYEILCEQENISGHKNRMLCENARENQSDCPVGQEKVTKPQYY